MLGPVKMRLRRSFPGIDDTTKLALSDVERNASDAVAALEQSKAQRWNVVTPTGPNYLAQEWDLVVVKADCDVVLPSPTASNAGCEVALVRVVSCALNVSSPGFLINTASSLLFPDSTMRRFVSSGMHWAGP
jgi:hypothetical protein